MIDIHNHLLPNFDDGATTIEESLQMCRIASEDGIGRIVATPHFDSEFAGNPEAIRESVQALNDVLRSREIPLQILPGMEIRISADIGMMLAQGALLTLNDSRFVLVELHPTQLPVGFVDLVNQLLSNGYCTVLAHPEKDAAIQRNPEVLYDWSTRLGPGRLCVQVSADSLIGDSGYRAMRTAKLLLKHNLVHVIATDAHSPTRRPPRLSRAMHVAARLVGAKQAAAMVNEAPQAIIDGKELPAFPGPTDPHRWWRIF